jgi:hypothetical protein
VFVANMQSFRPPSIWHSNNNQYKSFIPRAFPPLHNLTQSINPFHFQCRSFFPGLSVASAVGTSFQFTIAIMPCWRWAKSSAHSDSRRTSPGERETAAEHTLEA